MIASDLDFTRADESTVISNGTIGKRIGALVMLHELTHALGLEHTSGFATMRAGPTLAPFIGIRRAAAD